MRSLLLILLVLGSPLALGSEAKFACAGEEYRAFDFWVGTWAVRTPKGQLAGNNRISIQENGCLVLEEWQGIRGGTGQSYNYYNPGDQQWHQLWISKDAIIRYAGGLTDTGVMRLEGTITYQADGRTAPFIGQWAKEKDGTVLQSFKEWDAKTEQWRDWFIGRYPRPEPTS